MFEYLTFLFPSQLMDHLFSFEQVLTSGILLFGFVQKKPLLQSILNADAVYIKLEQPLLELSSNGVDYLLERP